MTQNKKTVDNGIDWERRLLCSDGSCIGIIGTDGRCKECGEEFKGKLPENLGIRSKGDLKKSDGKKKDQDNLLDTESNVESQRKEVGDKQEEIDYDWENRILCMDETCIGVVGMNGKCNTCGKPYEKKKP
jgi:hypothetical protein